MAKERVAAASDIPTGEVRVVQCGARSLAVSNLDGTLYAIDNRCTHDNGPLGEGQLRNGRVICPRHGAAFDAKTGRVLSLPAVRGVRAYEVTVDGDQVYIDCPDGAAS
ncbi:MAG: non-heme iron oxygenase ferredoxin subunit [Dehalococcoidia bacterium]|nr:MAG: non-heme iron oxygenase ferredoxin subunit [Dehalococcoidia bacterium]